MNILVTGGAGFIGSHMCDRLIKEGHDVQCVDNLLTGSRDNITHLLTNPHFRFVEHDVIQPLPQTIHADAVFHLASPASPNHHSTLSYHALPMETMLVNTVGTLELLKFAEKNKARFVFASTSEIYGNPLEHPQKETYTGNVSTTGPRSVYDEAKRFGETLSAYFFRDKKCDIRIARIFNTYGPRMLLADKRMIISFIEQALKHEPISVFGDGTQTRSLCFVDDTVDGLYRLMTHPDLAGEIVNIGNIVEFTVNEFAEKVIQLTGSKSSIVHTEKLPKDDPLRRKADITKAKKLLEWEPHTDLDTGLNALITFLKTKL